MDALTLSERNLLPQIGPHFFRGEDGELLFKFVIDTANTIGPRPATKRDSEAHPKAWAEFVAADAAVAERGGGVVEESRAAPAEVARREKRKYVRRAKVEA